MSTQITKHKTMTMYFEDIATKLEQASQRIREANRNAPIPCKFAVGDRVYMDNGTQFTQVVAIQFYPSGETLGLRRTRSFWRVTVKYIDRDDNQYRNANESHFTLIPFDDEVTRAKRIALETNSFQLICRGDWKIWFVTPAGELMTVPVAGYADASDFWRTHVWGDERYLNLEHAIAQQLTQL